MYNSKEILEGIYRAAPIGIGIVVDRVLVQVNAHMCRMMRHDEDELVGQSTLIWYKNDDEYQRGGE